MPYIDEEQRAALDPAIRLLSLALNANFPTGRDLAGPLNYAITRLLLETMPEDTRYSRLALIAGVLETIKLEFYRRMAVPYEVRKAEENGDVYPCPHNRVVPCLLREGQHGYSTEVCLDCGQEDSDGSDGE